MKKSLVFKQKNGAQNSTIYIVRTSFLSGLQSKLEQFLNRIPASLGLFIEAGEVITSPFFKFIFFKYEPDKKGYAA